MAAAQVDVGGVDAPTGHLATFPGNECQFSAQVESLRVARSASGQYVVEMGLSSAATSQTFAFAGIDGPIVLAEVHAGWLATEERPARPKSAAIFLRSFDCAAGRNAGPALREKPGRAPLLARRPRGPRAFLEGLPRSPRSPREVSWDEATSQGRGGRSTITRKPASGSSSF